MLSVLNDAKPDDAATVLRPLSVPFLGFVPSATVMLVLALVTRLPPASCTSTCTADIVAPPVVLVGCTKNASFVAVPPMMSKAAEVAPVNPLVDATSVYPVPILSMLRFENVATPLIAETGLVPESVPPPGLVPIAMAMLFDALVTRLPPASCTSTWTAGVIVAPAVVLVGWTRNPSLLAAPTVMVKGLEVAPVSPAVFAASV